MFLDSSPDRWGRVLMRRREALLARMGNRPQKNLMQSDFLLGVYDEHRMGNQRIHFASAMTMLGSKDGDNYSSGLSYLDIAGFIMQSGDKNQVNADLEELWKRIVFNICVKNTDDHLRNHGFLLGENGWKLSPAYDINPVPTSTGLTLNITEEDNSLDLKLPMEIAEFFRIEAAKAKETISNIKKVIKNWQKIAIKYGLSKREQDLMSAAFEHQ